MGHATVASEHLLSLADTYGNRQSLMELDCLSLFPFFSTLLYFHYFYFSKYYCSNAMGRMSTRITMLGLLPLGWEECTECTRKNHLPILQKDIRQRGSALAAHTADGGLPLEAMFSIHGRLFRGLKFKRDPLKEVNVIE
jgi:hypothetical protein